MEFTAVKGMLSMPICFVQEIAISQTIRAIFMGQKTKRSGSARLVVQGHNKKQSTLRLQLILFAENK